MKELIQTIESIRQKLPTLKRHALKETPTRTIVIDPLLESLGWDVRDPDEVQLEYPTVDNKSVDYALKLNNKPVLLVEAKALDDPLDDVKAATQVVGYATNDGIVWCVLTNGIKWRVYRSVEKCPTPDKLMYEISLDPNESEGMKIEQIAKQMWRFSAEEMARGTLDALGEQTFTDGKVRKALQILMTNPPRPFLNLVKKVIGDKDLAPQRIKESFARVAGEAVASEWSTGSPSLPKTGERSKSDQMPPVKKPEKAGQKSRTKKGESPFDEAHHLSGKPQEAIQLFRGLDRLCQSFGSGGIARRYLAKTIHYDIGKRCFCSVHVLQSGLRVWIRLKFNHIKNPPPFARDVSGIGHWGTGDVEMRISNRGELAAATDLLRQSFDAVS